MAESMPPPTEEQIRQLYRSLTEKVLDRAASDPAWKQQLLDDPEAILRAADFPELERVEQIRQSAEAPREEAEVVGHVQPNPNPYTNTLLPCCNWYSIFQ